MFKISVYISCHHHYIYKYSPYLCFFSYIFFSTLYIELQNFVRFLSRVFCIESKQHSFFDNINYLFQQIFEKRSKIIKFDIHIVENKKITFIFDIMSCNLQKIKKTNNQFIRNLIFENNYLRQKIVYYK